MLVVNHMIRNNNTTVMLDNGEVCMCVYMHIPQMLTIITTYTIPSMNKH